VQYNVVLVLSVVALLYDVLLYFVSDIRDLPNVPQHEPGRNPVAASTPKSRERLLDAD